MRALILIVLLAFFAAPTASAEGSANYPNVKHWIAFGDIHGDDRVLTDVLIQQGITDRNLKWAAGDTYVISMGDLLDRGPNSRRVMDIMMRLQREAAAAGGKFISLIGNHEMMVTSGDYRYFSGEDALNYKNFGRSGEAPESAIHRAFTGKSPYARWIASRPTAVSVGGTLFIHAGVERWIRTVSLEQLNDAVRAWLLYYQGNGEKPPASTQWVIGQEGPLWTRKLAQGQIEVRDLKNWLDESKLDRLVVGHSITESRKPEMPEQYKGRLMMIDTGMSVAYGGRPSTVEWQSGSFMKKERLISTIFKRTARNFRCEEILGGRIL